MKHQALLTIQAKLKLAIKFIITIFLLFGRDTIWRIPRKRVARGSARFAANPILDSRNQIIRISPRTIFNFRFQKSANRILPPETKVLKTENQ